MQEFIEDMALWVAMTIYNEEKEGEKNDQSTN